MENDVIIETKDLAKDYIDGGNVIHALNKANIKVRSGEMVGIMGPSGSGKSTLLYILGLLQPPTSGAYDREEQAHFRNRELGFVFQSCDLLANSTVFENLELPLIYAESDRNSRRKKVLEALDRVGLSHRVDHWSNRLSGGERQRAAIARALVNNPSLILGDEPTGQLDQKNTDIVVKQLRDLTIQGFTVVLVTHEDDIGNACDRIIRIRDGNVISGGFEEAFNGGNRRRSVRSIGPN
jgi:putative ABC transport system ATP-binding protein